MSKTLLITGGAGFVGSALVRYLLRETAFSVVNVDKLTYAGNLATLESVKDHPRNNFAQVDICDRKALESLFTTYQPDAVMHLAAETHVDRSIDNPATFIESNISGTFTLLETARHYWQKLEGSAKERFRFLHVSTDEVFGTLTGDALFSETSLYAPRSPYAASKAAADHLVRAWFHTYDFPVLITNCSNNYGPYQYPEKLIPVVVMKALAGEPIPVYGAGESVRDWLYVDDHVRGLLRVLERGKLGETYAIGGHNEVRTAKLVEQVCSLLDEFNPTSSYTPHASLITHVEDRPGHDLRYAIDASKMGHELDWTPQETFATGLRKTVRWYVDNQDWCERVMTGKYGLERLGLGKA